MKKNKNYCIKKVLICCTQNIFCENNTGITINSIFGRFNYQNLGQIYLWNDTFPLINNGKCGLSIKIDTNTHDYLLFYKDLIRQLKNPDFIKKIEAFNPDCIYLINSYWPFNLFVYKLSKILNTKLVVHHFDNIRETVNWKNYLLNYIVLRKIEKNSVLRLVISEEMREHYKKEYGFDYEVIMNSIDSHLFTKNIIPKQKNIKKIVYTGGLHLNRISALKKISNLLTKDSINNYELHIYTNSDKECETLLLNNNVVLHKCVRHSAIYEVYNTASILLHVESFNDDDLYYKYSVSTKISEYMMSKKPIICFAPKRLAVSQLLLKTKTGFVAENEEELINIFLKIQNNYDCVIDIVEKAYNYALEHFSTERVDQILKNSGFVF